MAVKVSGLIIPYPFGCRLAINARGIPWLCILSFPLFIAAIRRSRKKTFLPRAGGWILLSMVLVFLTLEVAERIFLDYLIFLIAFFGATSINAD